MLLLTMMMIDAAALRRGKKAEEIAEVF